MKGIGRVLLMLLLVGCLGFAQEAQEQSKEPQRKPSLGPAPAPSLRGPRTSTTTDARKLARIRNLYVDRIDNSLSDRLIEDLAKLGRFRIVTKPNEADATLRGSCLESRRLKRLHSEVFIADRNGESVWQDDIYTPFNPPSLAQAVNQSARVVVEHLGASIREAERK